jgi:hypothetical protein
MSRLAVVLATLVSPLAPATVLAHRPLYLSMAVAKRSVTTYERLYWKGHEITLQVSHCQRHSAVQVSCLSQATSKGTTITARDWARLLPQNVIRVHPGSIEAVLTLE